MGCWAHKHHRTWRGLPDCSATAQRCRPWGPSRLCYVVQLPTVVLGAANASQSPTITPNAAFSFGPGDVRLQHSLIATPTHHNYAAHPLQAKIYDKWEDHLGQLLAELLASREEYALGELAPALDEKRKISDDDVEQYLSQVRALPSFAATGVATRMRQGGLTL